MSHVDRIFEARPLTADEQAAIADEPRNGIWWQPSWMLGGPADKRPLTQEQTDRLIAHELLTLTCGVPPAPNSTLAKLTEPYAPAPIDLVVELNQVELNQVRAFAFGPPSQNPPKITLARTAHCQRNGIHSDPLIRVLAYRVWGERDRKWQSMIDTIVKVAEMHGAQPVHLCHAAQGLGGDPRALQFTDDLRDYFTAERR
jgi:hypothetical protein